MSASMSNSQMEREIGTEVQLKVSKRGWQPKQVWKPSSIQAISKVNPSELLDSPSDERRCSPI